MQCTSNVTRCPHGGHLGNKHTETLGNVEFILAELLEKGSEGDER